MRLKKSIIYSLFLGLLTLNTAYAEPKEASQVTPKTAVKAKETSASNTAKSKQAINTAAKTTKKVEKPAENAKKMNSQPAQPKVKNSPAAENKTETTAAKKPENAQAANGAAQAESEKRFYRNVDIKFMGQGAREKNGQIVIFTRYQIANKSKVAIKEINWEIIYALNNNPFHNQNVNIKFPQPYLQKKTSFELEVELNFNDLSPAAKDLMVQPNSVLTSLVKPKSIRFVNNNFLLEVK